MAGRTPIAAFARTVDRYLDALRGSSLQVRRRERSNCNSLLRGLQRSDEPKLSEAFIEDWLSRAGEPGSDVRARRLATLRRLIALWPGEDSKRVALWLDSNRKRLLGARARRRVVPLRSSPDPTIRAREEAMRYVKQAERYLDEGTRARALPLAKRALKVNPACLRAHALVGVMELQAGRPDRALRQLRQALVMAGDLSGEPDVDGVAAVLDGLGRAMIYVGHVDDAYDVYMRVVRINREWEGKASGTMGRLCLLRDEPGEAARWFQLSSEPLRHYDVFLAHVESGNALQSMISLGRGLLTNPLVPSELLARSEGRFEESFEPELAQSLRKAAHEYAVSHRELWDRDPTMRGFLAALWDHPAVRTFLMRALPLAKRSPTSTRLAVFIHNMASQLSQFAHVEGFILGQEE